MYWPDTNTGVDIEPIRKPVASAVRKFFTEGGVGQPPTVPGGDWFNQITNELLNVLAAAGIDPSKTNDDQLLLAINTLLSSKTDPLRDGGLWNPSPANEYGDQTAAVTQSRRNTRTDNHIWFLGDSHGWGQGAPDYIPHSILTNFSTRSSYLGSRGFVAQAIEKICQARGWSFGLHHLQNHKIGASYITGNYGVGNPKTDPEMVVPLRHVSGKLKSSLVALAALRTRAIDGFYSPNARGDAYETNAYREKMAIGKFSKSLTELSHESVTAFFQDNKDHFYQFPVNASFAAGAANFTDVLGDGGAVVATRSNTTGATFIITTNPVTLPLWATINSIVFLPGYGMIKLQASFATGAIEIRTPAGAIPDISIMKFFYQGFRVYPGAYIDTAIVSADITEHSSRAYIALQCGPGRGKARVYFTDSITAGGRCDPYFTFALKDLKANGYSPVHNNPSFPVLAYTMRQNGSLEPNDTPFLTVDNVNKYVEIDCETASVEEAIVVVDFGGRTVGRLFIESVDSAKSIAFRGVVFDNNYAVNYALGGHTVSAWLGLSAGGSDATTVDHIGNFLAGSPVRPSSVVVQVPFVNEYLAQTPIATFKANLATLVSRISSYLPDGVNQYGTSFLFYTSLRARNIAFEGAASSPITYSMYVEAAKEFCIDNGHQFADIESKLLDIPEALGIDYQRLYWDTIHPSDMSNMLIADELCKHVMSLG